MPKNRATYVSVNFVGVQAIDLLHVIGRVEKVFFLICIIIILDMIILYHVIVKSKSWV